MSRFTSYLYNENNQKINLFRYWVILFFVSLFISLLVQCVVLPLFFNTGNGLLEFDSMTYHGYAALLANKIKQMGWSVWELRPSGQAPSGIASILYTLFIPKPWVLIPIYSLLFATSGIVIICIANRFSLDTKIVLLAPLPFLFYPSAMMWYTQPLKDAYSICGMLLFLYGWLLLIQIRQNLFNFRRSYLPVAFIFSGAFLCWIVRPYLFDILLYINFMLAALGSMWFTAGYLGHRRDFKKAAVIVFNLWFISIALYFISNHTRVMSYVDSALFKTNIIQQKTTKERLSMVENEIAWSLNDSQKKEISLLATAIPESRDYNITVNDPDPGFQNSIELSNLFKRYIPGYGLISSIFTRVQNKLDVEVHKIIIARSGFSGYMNARSSIDSEIYFENLWDLIYYIPRAIQIAFLSPFPNMWFKQGSYPYRTLMRKVTAVEMLLSYAFLSFFIYFSFLHMKHLEYWIVVAPCFLILILYTLSITNIGTLYRMRYPYFMVFVTLGGFGMLSFYSKYFKNNKHLHLS